MPQTEVSANNKALVRNFIQELNEKGNRAAFDEFLHPGFFLYNSHSHGPDAYRKIVDTWPADMRFDIEDMIAADDLVVFTWTATATRDGAPWNRTGMSALRIADGKIIEDRFWSKDVLDE